MKRLVWFTVGAAAGVSGSAYVKRKARQAAERYKPVNIAKGAVDRVSDAVREGRAAMAAREAELRAGEEVEPEPIPVLVVEPFPASAAVSRRAAPGQRRRSRR